MCRIRWLVRAGFGSTLAAMALGAAMLRGCGGGGVVGGVVGGVDAPAAATGAAALSAQATLGELIFHDTSLSASGRQACSTCHSADAGHAAANSLPAQLGGAHLDLQGARTAPGIRYLAGNRAFRLAADGTPTGGFFWDCRAVSLADQAHAPFLNPVEMANVSVDYGVARLARAAYAEQFKTVFGGDIFSRPDDAFARVTLALQQYPLEDADFRPFSSKYDAFLRGQAALTATEQHGLALFNAPAKGNCAACHPSARAADGSPPLFTDFSYDNLGVPRNVALAQNADPAYFDLGLCARPAADLAQRADLCGAFKVSSLRNVALRKAYFHNGRFGTLKEALTFYVQRHTHPEKGYPMRADGTLDVFNDLPPAWRGNVNRSEAPYNPPYNRQRGDAPALSDAEIDELIAFLATLSDGYTPWASRCPSFFLLENPA